MILQCQRHQLLKTMSSQFYFKLPAGRTAKSNNGRSGALALGKGEAHWPSATATGGHLKYVVNSHCPPTDGLYLVPLFCCHDLDPRDNVILASTEMLQH